MTILAIRTGSQILGSAGVRHVAFDDPIIRWFIPGQRRQGFISRAFDHGDTRSVAMMAGKLLPIIDAALVQNERSGLI